MNIDEAILLTHDRLGGEGENMGELLGHFRSRVSPVLVGDREWEQVLECAGQLPITMGALPFGFELPLHEARPQADFGASLASGTNMAASFEERARADETDKLAQAIVRLFREMDAENSPLREIVGRKLMLEYDIGSAPDGKQTFPGMFLRPGERPIVGPEIDKDQWNDVKTVVDALVSCVGWDANEAQQQVLERVYRTQPADTRMDSFGVFPSRSRSLRLAVMGFKTQDELNGYLENTAWPGDIRIVDSVLSQLRKTVSIERTGLNIDVGGNEIGPTLGITPIVKQRYTKDLQYWLDGLADWDAFLEALSREVQVVPEKLAALAEWVSKPTPLYGKSGRFVLLRGIHHIKLVIAEDQPVKAKAYVFMVLSAAASF